MREAGERPAGPGDRAQLERAAGGDADAFQALVAGRLDGSWQLARAILGTDEAATDAVATAVSAAWLELGRLDDLDRFDAWLDRILLAECRMRLLARPGGHPRASVPPELLAETMDRIRQAPPKPPLPRSPGGRGWPTWAWGAAAVALVAVAAIGLAVGRLVQLPGGAGPSAAGIPPPVATEPGPAADPTPGPVPTFQATPPPVADELGAGALAMVTLDGDNLRVRSAPGTGDDSRKLRPLLPAGTRMLVVGGPVLADGYDWYEVWITGELADLVGLFGWVAAGRDDIEWIAPTAPRCFGSADADAVAAMSPVDFLACYGDTEVRLVADASSLWDVREPAGDCGWVRRRDGCAVDNAWLLLASTEIRFAASDGTAADLLVAVPPELAAPLASLPRRRTLTLTVSMGSPEASGCRIRDAATGALLMPPDQAIAACRLRFVVQGVAFLRE